MRRVARDATTASPSATSRTGASTSSPAPIRASTTTTLPPMPTSEGRLLALDARGRRSTAAPIPIWPFTIGLEPGQATGNLPGPYDFRGYRCKTYCVATNKPGFLPYRGVARTGVCFAMELMIDAIARAVEREPYEVRLDNLVPPGADALRQRHAQALRQRRLSGKPAARRARRSTSTNARAAESEASPTAHASASASRPIASSRRTAPACSRRWGMPVMPGLRPGGGARSRRTAGWRCASACTRTARAWKPPWRRSPTRSSASTSRRCRWCTATPARRRSRPAPMPRAAW